MDENPLSVLSKEGLENYLHNAIKNPDSVSSKNWKHIVNISKDFDDLDIKLKLNSTALSRIEDEDKVDIGTSLLQLAQESGKIEYFDTAVTTLASIVGASTILELNEKPKWIYDHLPNLNTSSQKDANSFMDFAINQDFIDEAAAVLNEQSIRDSKDLMSLTHFYDRMHARFPSQAKSVNLGRLAYQAVALEGKVDGEEANTLKKLFVDVALDSDQRAKLDPLQVSAISYHLMDEYGSRLIRALNEDELGSLVKLGVNRSDLSSDSYANLLSGWGEIDSLDPAIGYNLFFKIDDTTLNGNDRQLLGLAVASELIARNATSQQVQNFAARAQLPGIDLNIVLENFSQESKEIALLYRNNLLGVQNAEQDRTLGKFFVDKTLTDPTHLDDVLFAYGKAIQTSTGLDRDNMIRQVKISIETLFENSDVLTYNDELKVAGYFHNNPAFEEFLDKLMSPRAKAFRGLGNLSNIDESISNLEQWLPLMREDEYERHADGVRVYNQGTRLLEREDLSGEDLYRLFNVFFEAGNILDSDPFAQRARDIAQDFVDKSIESKESESIWQFFETFKEIEDTKFMYELSSKALRNSNVDLSDHINELLEIASQSEGVTDFIHTIDSALVAHEDIAEKIFEYLEKSDSRELRSKGVDIGYLVFDQKAYPKGFGLRVLDLAASSALEKVNEGLEIINNGSPEVYRELTRKYKENEAVLDSIAQTAIVKGEQKMHYGERSNNPTVKRDGYTTVVEALVDLKKFDEAYEFASENKFTFRDRVNRKDRTVDLTSSVAGKLLGYANAQKNDELRAKAYQWRGDEKKLTQTVTNMVSGIVGSASSLEDMQRAVDVARQFGAEPGKISTLNKKLNFLMLEAELNTNISLAANYAELGAQIGIREMGTQAENYKQLLN